MSIIVNIVLILVAIYIGLSIFYVGLIHFIAGIKQKVWYRVLKGTAYLMFLMVFIGLSKEYIPIIVNAIT